MCIIYHGWLVGKPGNSLPTQLRLATKLRDLYFSKMPRGTWKQLTERQTGYTNIGSKSILKTAITEKDRISDTNLDQKHLVLS